MNLIFPQFYVTGRSNPVTLGDLIQGDFKFALPKDPESNPAALIEILNNVLGKFFRFSPHSP